jgi:hypothetical protein
MGLVPASTCFSHRAGTLAGGLKACRRIGADSRPQRLAAVGMPEPKSKRPDPIGSHPQHQTGLAHVGDLKPADARRAGLAGGIGQYLAHGLPSCLELRPRPLGTHWGRKLFGCNGIEPNAVERKSPCNIGDSGGQANSVASH